MELMNFRVGHILMVLLVTVGLIGGCAAPGTSTQRHTAGTAVEVENSVATPVPFEQTWDQFVAQIARSFFVINNIAKDSRIINVSFTSDTPELYVDCGTTERQFEFQEERQTYTYPTAASSRYKAAVTWGPHDGPATVNVIRKASVEGRANIYVAPKENGTVVSVNAVYVWTGTVSGSVTRYDAYGRVMSEENLPSREPSIIRLTTAEPGKVDWGDGEDSTCFATGRFEREILALVPR